MEFRTRDGVAKAVNGVNYSVAAGETLAVLGESGSGKSVTAQAIMGILDMPPGRIPKGEILFRGQDMLKMSGEERRKIRGNKIAMIFQDALSSLNPVLSVGYQLGEMFRVHQGMSKKDAKAKAIELMDRVKIPAARERVGDYPHQFSGGMRQRIMIAMAHTAGELVRVVPTRSLAAGIFTPVHQLDRLGLGALGHALVHAEHLRRAGDTSRREHRVGEESASWKIIAILLQRDLPALFTGHLRMSWPRKFPWGCGRAPCRRIPP
ncbi:hypothetical protein SVIOM74S_09591 [Streptomyces violarus]